MKKIYVEPTLKMVKIGTSSLLNNSPSGSGTVTIAGDGEYFDGSGDSKRFTGGLYDDEEDTGSEW